MPANGHTLGSDCTIDVFDPLTNQLLTLVGKTGFEPRQMSDASMRRRLDGSVHPIVIPGGWEGTIALDRTDDEVDRWMSAMEDLYYEGRQVPAGSITETITNPSGSVSQYRYDEVMFRYDNAGRRSGEAVVEISLAWQAGRRIKVL